MLENDVYFPAANIPISNPVKHLTVHIDVVSVSRSKGDFLFI